MVAARSTVRSPGIRTRWTAARSETAGPSPSGADRPGCGTYRTTTPRPIRPAHKLTTNTASYPPGAAASTAKASTGPVIAPAMSSARCTPNAAPHWARGVAMEIIASRGDVRIPLPRRSTSTRPATAPHTCPTSTIPRRATVDSPYPATATCLCRRARSATRPPSSRTGAVAPVYSPSTAPNTNGERCRPNTRYNGSTAVTISADTSVNRLVRPSARTVRLTHGRAVGPAARRAE